VDRLERPSESRSPFVPDFHGRLDFRLADCYTFLKRESTVGRYYKKKKKKITHQQIRIRKKLTKPHLETKQS
jgi:hypothetical protein